MPVLAVWGETSHSLFSFTTMELKEKKIDNSGQKTRQEQLDEVFIQGPGEMMEKYSRPEKKKNRYFKDLVWYWMLIRTPVFILAGLEISLYFLSLIPGLKFVMIEVFDPILFLVNFIFFGWLMVLVLKKKGENLWQGTVTLFLAGFALGLIMSIFKIFWIREYWTFYNLIVEPVFMGMIAVIVGLIVSLFIKKNKKIIN